MEEGTENLIQDGNFTQELIGDMDFCDFVLREAERTIVHATVEELAIFGFGNLEDAIEAYREHKEPRG